MSLLLLFAGIGTGERGDRHDGGYVKLTDEEIRFLQDKLKRFRKSKNASIEERREQEQELRQSLERAVYGIEAETPAAEALIEAARPILAPQSYADDNAFILNIGKLNREIIVLQKAVAAYLAEIERQDEEDIEFLLMGN